MSGENSLQKYGTDAINSLKKTNWVVRIAMALLFGAGLYLGLPYVVSIIENTFQIVLGLTKTMLIGIPAFFAATFFWANRSFLRKLRERWSRKLWQNFIYNDPLDYIEGVIQDFEKARGLMKEAIAKLRGVLAKLKQKASDLIDKYNNGIKMADAFEQEGDTGEAEIQAYFASSSARSAEDIQRIYLDTEESVSLLQELERGLAQDIKVMRFDLEMMKTHLEVAEIQGQVADVMQEAMNGGGVEEMARREYAKWAYKDKVSKLAGKFNQFLTDVEPILKAKRIEQVINTKEGRKALETFRKNRNDMGGLKSFNEEIQRLKSENPDQYGSGKSVVDVNKFTKKTQRYTTGGGGASFGHLQ